MSVNAFLATAADLQRLLASPTAPPPGRPLTGRGPEQNRYLWVADGP